VPERSLTKDTADDDDEEAGSDQDDPPPPPAGKPGDPYSNLDGAFSNYLANEPQLIKGSGKHSELDDLLF